MTTKKQNSDRFEAMFEEIGQELCAHAIAIIQELQENAVDLTDEADESTFQWSSSKKVTVKMDSKGNFSKSASHYTAGMPLKNCRLRVISPTGSTKFSGKLSTNYPSSFSFSNLVAGKWTDRFNLRTNRFSKTKISCKLSTSPELPNTDVTLELEYSTT